MAAPPPYTAAGAYPDGKPGEAPPVGFQYGGGAGFQQPPPPQQHQPYGYAVPPAGQQQPFGYGAPAQPATQQPQPSYGAGGGFQDQPEAGPEVPIQFGSGFSDKAIRHAFIRKVYLILTAQLLVTVVFVAIAVLVDSVKRWVQANMWFYILAYVLFIVLYITLVCCRGVRTKYPGNYIALAVFTLAFSYMAAAIASFHTAEAVLIAAGITAVVVFAISLFAIQTKIDFTMCHGLMFAAGMTLLVAGIAFFLISISISNADNRTHYILQCVYGSIAALVLSLFLVFDTQRVVGGKRKNALSPEEYIVGALELYLDIVYLFLIILSFFGGSSD